MNKKIVAVLGTTLSIGMILGGVALAGGISNDPNISKLNDTTKSADIYLETYVQNETENVNTNDSESINTNDCHGLGDDKEEFMEILKENGYEDMAKHMQSGNYEDMDEFMNSMTEQDYEKILKLMKENGYEDMAQMMESMDRESMIEMHNSMKNMHESGFSMMGNY